MTATMFSLLPKGEWQDAHSYSVNADGLALNLVLVDRANGQDHRSHLSFHYTGMAGAMGSAAAKDAEAIGRDRLASMFVAAAGALFESATPAVQRRMGFLIEDRNGGPVKVWPLYLREC